ncbi:MAG: alpha-glucan family phosphorylase, partial [Candidatus Altiarchaeota archaeon]|nr:alpha-glucan family phosphorylase [Candidatus Altiarchaeota archaeon]
ALNIPRDEISNAHREAKEKLIDFINEHYHVDMGYDTLTMGFARRATAYKRADLLFSDMERLRSIVKEAGDLQIIYGGKAHPSDGQGKEFIKKIFNHIRELKDDLKIVYLRNYDMYAAKLMVTGCDLWLNTPLRPMEASGTSGMKAAVNGVLNFSVLDGWWLEGHMEGYTGWSIGPRPKDVEQETDQSKDIEDLYTKLKEKIIPTYYEDPEWWLEMMTQNIALNGSFFNTHRMVSQYIMKAYFV